MLSTNNILKKNSKLYDFIGITLGTFLTALALSVFLEPNNIAPGGVSGIAIEINYLTGWPVGMVTIIINIPLFLLAIKILGAKFGIKTFYATILLGVLIDVTSKLPTLTKTPILATVYGGFLMGLGLGLVIKFHATTGGTDLAAMVLHKYLKNLTVGKLLLLIDFFVILGAAVIFNPEKAMYALVADFLNVKVIDIMQEGISTNRMAIIVSNKREQLVKSIIDELDRGATILDGKGGFTGQNKEVILCVVDKNQVLELSEIVKSIDDKAFVVLLDAYDVMGEGFNKL